MQELEINEELPYPIAAVWAIVGTLDRVDWVPSITSAELRGDERHMYMQGAGDLVEKIFVYDPDAHRIEYGVIKSDVGLTHHRATLQLKPSTAGCTLQWQLEVEPDAFGQPIGATMRECVTQIRAILESN